MKEMNEKEMRAMVKDIKARGFTKVSHFQDRGQNWSTYTNPETKQSIIIDHEIDSDYKRTGKHWSNPTNDSTYSNIPIKA